MSVLLITFLLVLVGGVVSSVAYLSYKIDQLGVSTGGTATVSAAISRRYDRANLVVITDFVLATPSPNPTPIPTIMTLAEEYYPLVFATNQDPVVSIQTTNSNTAKFSLNGVNDSSNNRIIYTPDFPSFEGRVISLNFSTSCQVHVTGASPVELLVGIGMSADTTSLSVIHPICISMVYFNTGSPVDTDFNFAMSYVLVLDENIATSPSLAFCPIIQTNKVGVEFSTRSIVLSIQETPFNIKSF